MGTAKEPFFLRMTVVSRKGLEASLPICLLKCSLFSEVSGQDKISPAYILSRYNNSVNMVEVDNNNVSAVHYSFRTVRKHDIIIMIVHHAFRTV